MCILVCEKGQFGQDCALKCNTACQGCNNINGVCDTGCITGWKGVYCHEGSTRFTSITFFEKKMKFLISKIKLFQLNTPFEIDIII